jgi:predicted RNA-binding Zn ribbon-like protein
MPPLVLVDPDSLESGGAPTLGEPLAVEFGNTRYAVRGNTREGLAKPEHLAAWLRDYAGAFDPGAADAAIAALAPGDLDRFLRLRDVIRDCAHEITEGRRPSAALIDELNAAAALAPRWPRLDLSGDALTVTAVTSAAPVDAVLGAIARSAVEIFGGPDRAALRSCGGPGCVLFFIKNHPRREWCSPGCGNRARVARHYDRHRATKTR